MGLSESILNRENFFALHLNVDLPLDLSKSFNLKKLGSTYILQQNDMEIARGKINNPGEKSFIDRALNHENRKIIVSGVKQVDREVFLSLFVFKEEIKWSKVDPLLIEVNLDKNKDLSIAEFKKHFMFDGNKIVVFGQSVKDQKSFTIICHEYIADVKFDDSKYFISAIKSNRKGKDWAVPFFLFSGSIDFKEKLTYKSINKQQIEKISQLISQNDSYFSIWAQYNKLEQLNLHKMINKIGICPYSSYTKNTTSKSTTYSFTLKDERDFNPDIPSENLSLVCTDSKEILGLNELDEDSFEKADKILSKLWNNHKLIDIGIFKRKESDTITTESNSEISLDIPKSGYIFASPIGDFLRLKRREGAKKIIIDLSSPLPLAEIVEEAIFYNQVSTNNVDGSTKLTSLIKKTNFTDNQIKAIQMAVNTPDIAIIQGPPGTGKTEVLRAIVEVYKHEYSKKFSHNDPKILITSYQHDAVNNAIAGVDYAGLPVNRIGGKKDDENIKQNRMDEIERWVNQKKAFFQQNIDSSIDSYRKMKQSFCGEILLWKSKKRPIEEGKKLIQKYIELYPALFEPIQKRSESILKNQDKTYFDDNVSRSLKDQIGKMPLSKDEFISNEGRKLVYRLKHFVINSSIEGVDLQILDDVINECKDDSFSDIKFQEYLDCIDKLKVSRNLKGINETDSSLGKEIESILLEMFKIFEQNEFIAPTDVQTKKSNVLHEFNEGLNDMDEADNLIKKYSRLLAGTCQQISNLSFNPFQGDYDLVLVDEAARANPLDLFIPLSRANKVVLIGDHKQLPHFLEDSIVKDFIEKKKIEEIDILTKSFLEILYDKFQNTSANAKSRTIMLQEQFRMHPIIGNFVSEQFYDNQLLSNMIDPVKLNLHLPVFHNKPIVFIDLPLALGSESGGSSKERHIEAEQIVRILGNLMKVKIPINVGIISFYNKQVEVIQSKYESLLKKNSNVSVKIGTVDAFQGSEFDVVMLSCVRSNNCSNVGFVSDPNRLCVSFSRAKSMMICIGDINTLKSVAPIYSFCEKCKKEGYYAKNLQL